MTHLPGRYGSLYADEAVPLGGNGGSAGEEASWWFGNVNQNQYG